MKKFVMALLFMVGCAGASKDCSSCVASSAGADWLLVQYRTDGSPAHCWNLHNVSLELEGSDGVYWQHSGHIFHISGWFAHVQVSGGDFNGAKVEMGLGDVTCLVQN